MPDASALKDVAVDAVFERGHGQALRALAERDQVRSQRPQTGPLPVDLANAAFDERDDVAAGRPASFP